MRRFVAFGPAFVVLLTCALTLFAAPAVLRQYSFARTSARITLARQTLADDDILQRINQATAAVTDAVMPSVVHIDTGFGERTGIGASGAGWVYDSRGHIVTNAHVVRGAESIAVEFSDGRSLEARLVGSDPYTDIAVLRVNGSDGFFPVARAERSLPRQGERVFAFGSPFGFKFSMSQGIVSGLGRENAGTQPFGGYTNYIQTDAAVNPGNSGGPLVNVSGELIGMNVAIATARSHGGALDDAEGDSAGISFAIPLGTIEPIVGQIVNHGAVRRGFIGIVYSSRTVEHIETDDGNVFNGVRVREVTDDGPAAASGMRSGDVIIEVEGMQVFGTDSIASVISSARPGNSIDVEVVRDGNVVPIQITLAEMPGYVLVDRVRPYLQLQLGLVVDNRFRNRPAQVVRVWDGTPAAIAGLRQGDVIVNVGGTPVGDYVEFFQAISDKGLLAGRSVTLFVRSEGDSGRDTREIELSLYPG